jgi:hypothetical protein
VRRLEGKGDGGDRFPLHFPGTSSLHKNHHAEERAYITFKFYFIPRSYMAEGKGLKKFPGTYNAR